VGIFNSRKLQWAWQENLAFKYLTGMETLAFRTLIEFWQRHRENTPAVFLWKEVGTNKLLTERKTLVFAEDAMKTY
jgi:hypothetical protein